MNSKKAKSSSPWISRLFKQAGNSLPSAQAKTYFAQCYPDSIGHKTGPFGALFSGVTYDADAFPHPANQDNLQTCALFPPNALAGLNAYNDDNPASPLLTVVNSFDETPDTKTFHLVNQSGGNFDYLPGQYITLSVVINDQLYKRSYSLASSPSRPRTLSITVKRSPNGGIVSNWLNDNLKIGDKLAFKGPYGKFSCVPQPHSKILLIAAGSGIVPIMSMLRWLADTHANVDVQCLLSFRTPDDIIFNDELQLIAARHSNINVAITLTTRKIADYDWFGLTGRIDERLIQQITPDVQDRTAYLCGPEEFMASCITNLIKLDLPVEKMFCESFNVASPVSGSAVANSGHKARNTAETYQINFAKSGLTVSANGNQTLLELAEQAGIRIDHDCRNGNCGECMIKCLQGKVEMTEQAEIDNINREKGWVYSCCAYPASDLIVEI